MLAVLSMAIGMIFFVPVAIPPANAAMLTSTGYTIDWCDPGPCDPDRQYAEGMPTQYFKDAGGQCGADNNSLITDWTGMTKLANGRGGWANPEGLLSGYQSTIRWILGEPVWCTSTPTMPAVNINNIRIALRYYVIGTERAWKYGPAGTGNAISFGANGQPLVSLTLDCLSTTGTLTSLSASGSQILGDQSVNASTGTIGEQRMSQDGKFSYRTYFFTLNTAQRTLLNNTTTCDAIRGITVKINNDKAATATTLSIREWSGAYAMRGTPRPWDGNTLEELRCDEIPMENWPIECGEAEASPFTRACNATNPLDATTWGNLGPCVFGTPDDYIAGATALSEVAVTIFPLPGTGSCGPWSVGTIMGQPFVLDMCSWYMPARPIFDVVMTAGLWASLVWSFFRTRAGE